MTIKDYYKVLGVSMDASSEHIKSAYRQLVRKYHPDRNSRRGTEKLMAEINKAYTTLSSKERRQLYDDKLRELRKRFESSADFKEGMSNSSAQNWNYVAAQGGISTDPIFVVLLAFLLVMLLSIAFVQRQNS